MPDKIYGNRNKNTLKKGAPFVLLVLDGWGIAPSWGGNAISLSKTPCFDHLWREYPSCTLQASGQSVGLPEGSPGNSEAGHLNIGAGRIVHQDISVIDEQIRDNKLSSNKILNDTLNHAKENKSNLHIMGLLSDIGTHSHIRHLRSLLESLANQKFSRVFIHLFSDGRDSDPMKGIELIGQVEKMISETGVGSISSITGRFYAMDRNNRWGRTARAYNAMVKSEAEIVESPGIAFSSSYSRGITDEFIEPKIIANKQKHFSPVKDNDSIIIFNFRFDRIKQIIDAFLEDKIAEFPDRQKLSNLYVATFSHNGEGSKFKSIFETKKIANPLAQVLSANKYSQLHIAETEKFPHVTYFINGGETNPFPDEFRIMIPSPKVRTYDLLPEMSAEGVKNALIKNLTNGLYDFYIINFANADMVGHTGNLEATMQAVIKVDQCLSEITTNVLNRDGTLFVCADHGNAEQMVNPQTGEPDTEHTLNPVPFILVNEGHRGRKLKANGSLSNISPTILSFMNIDKPNEMNTRESLIDESG